MKHICETAVAFLHRTVTGPRRMRRLFAPLFAGFFLCVILFVIIGSFFMDRFFGLPRFIPETYGRLISLPFLIAGIFLWGWSVWEFLKTKGTPVPVDPPPKLVTGGPYAYARNPMLTGIYMLFAGIGIFCGSVFLTFIGTPAFVFASIVEFKCIEEPELEKRFGKAYTDYRDKTPLIVPRLRRK